MYLKRLNLSNFKNYSEIDIGFSPRINCFVGDNGVGKTNILDAIHYLSLTKSYFVSVDSINIRHGYDYFIIKGIFQNKHGSEKIMCGLQKGKRKVFRRDGKEYTRISEHIGRYPVVMISPADNSIITDGSEERRKFMNNVISQFNREYLDDIISYNKALKQRNRLLKDYAAEGKFDRQMLELWEMQMQKPGKRIFDSRAVFVEEIIPLFQKYYDHISEKREQVKLNYRSQLLNHSMNELFDMNIEKDRILKYTTSGIHRDDLNLEMDGYSIRDIGSQGQQKSYLVALKLAKFEYISKKGGLKPVLLMDDVFDKFDEKRVAQIIELVSDNRFGQIFITDTHKDRMQAVLSQINIEYKLFMIDEGIREIVINGKGKT
ncbi:MAG TPA: DNA replication and repair protein RecF [Bacteroidales bacterium]|nr:DNA replication and repair protein RecF [Bacteroidales bacterium]